MDAGLFIYFPRDPGHSIYFKVFVDNKIYILKNCQPPPPGPRPESTVRPLTKKRDQFQPFPNSTDCHTKNIAMLHGLWPSICNKNEITASFSQNF